MGEANHLKVIDMQKCPFLADIPNGFEEGSGLRLFCQELGISEKLTFDGSKETGKGTHFM